MTPLVLATCAIVMTTGIVLIALVCVLNLCERRASFPPFANGGAKARRLLGRERFDPFAEPFGDVPRVPAE